MQPSMLSPQLLEATQSLVAGLLASETFIHFRNAQTHLDTEGEARALIDQLSQAQAQLRQKQANGGANQADIDALREIQLNVRNNQAIMDFFNSQQEAVYFVREINGEIDQLLGISFATFANHATC